MGISGAANGFCGGELGVIADSIAAATVCCKFPKKCLLVTIVALSSVCLVMHIRLHLYLMHIRFSLKRFTKAREQHEFIWPEVIICNSTPLTFDWMAQKLIFIFLNIIFKWNFYFI